MNGERRELEHQADVSRARLVGTIEALERKRHELFDWKLQLRRHSNQVIGALIGMLAGVGVTAGIGVYRAARRDRHIRSERLRALVRIWYHPDRVAPKGSVIGTALRMLLVAAASMATTSVAIRQLETRRRRPRLPRPPTEPIGV